MEKSYRFDTDRAFLMKWAEMKKIDQTKFENEYKEFSADANRLCSELSIQISKLFEISNIRLAFPIQTRVKSWGSIVNKITNANINIKSLLEMQDFIGVRIIVLYKRDIEKVKDLISSNFEIQREYDTLDRMNQDQFGYSSIHIVASLPKEWLKLPTFFGLGKYQFEIQLRTMAQHIWAEVSHDLQYKNMENVPSVVQRSISRVSAVLEIVDLEFERVLGLRETYRNEIALSDSDEKLNVDILEKIFDELLPIENKGDDEDYSGILYELTILGVTSKRELINIIRDNLVKAILLDKEMVSSEKARILEGGPPRKDNEEQRLNRGVYFVHTGLIRNILELVFAEKYLALRSKLLK